MQCLRIFLPDGGHRGITMKLTNSMNTGKLKTIPWKLIIGLAIGGTIGFLYYYFIGCASGTCPITSNPYASVLYGAVMGGIVSRM
jgi:hypothetical protein